MASSNGSCVKFSIVRCPSYLILGFDDILVGGLDVGSILVYPQDQATSSLFLTPWNNPFDVLQTETNIFFYYEFVDADGDGDVVSQFIHQPT